MMNDIIEEPEKDTLLGMQPEPQVLSVMLAKASYANVLVRSGSCRPQPSICIIGRELNKSYVRKTRSDTLKFVCGCVRLVKLAHIPVNSPRISLFFFFLRINEVWSSGRLLESTPEGNRQTQSKSWDYLMGHEFSNKPRVTWRKYLEIAGTLQFLNVRVLWSLEGEI